MSNTTQRKTVTDRNSFVLYKDFNSTIQKLSDEQAGKLIKAVYEFNLTGIVPELDFTLDIVITPLIEQFKRDHAKYQARCNRNKENAKKRWDKTVPDNKQADATACDRMQMDAKHAVSVSVSDSDSDNKKTKGFYTYDFESFWSIYPKKKGKGGAFASWKKIKNRPDTNEIISAVQSQSKSDDWKKDNGQFIPNPQTWLNQRRWEDEGFLMKSEEENVLEGYSID